MQNVYQVPLILHSALVKDLRSNQNSAERVAVLADRITNLTCRMHQLTFERADNNAVLIQIHSNAVTLWNIAVAMKTGSGQTGTTENAKCMYFFPSHYLNLVVKVRFHLNHALTLPLPDLISNSPYSPNTIRTVLVRRIWYRINK